MTRWGWSDRTSTKKPAGIAWLSSFVSAVPWIIVLMLLLMFYLISTTLTYSHGVLFDLPTVNFNEGAETKLVAVIMPLSRSGANAVQNTLVFFDDARYILGDDTSERILAEQIAERIDKIGNRTMLVLCDRRIQAGELMHFAELAKRNGIMRILFAERKETTGEL